MSKVTLNAIEILLCQILAEKQVQIIKVRINCELSSYLKYKFWVLPSEHFFEQKNYINESF